MESKKAAKQVLDEIRDYRRLKHLRLRPRNLDGSLNLSCKVNRAFTKHQQVSDYYDPEQTSVDVHPWVIQELKDLQQKEYDDLRFKELKQRYMVLHADRDRLISKTNEQIELAKEFWDGMVKCQNEHTTRAKEAERKAPQL